MSTKKNRRIGSTIYILILFLFLYAPIAVTIFFSFNESKSTSVFTSFSLRWYKDLFQNQEAMRALFYTVVIALLSSLSATVLGTAAAVGIDKMKRLPKNGAMFVTNIPMMNPEVVTGVSMLLLFVFIGTLIHKDSILGFGTLLITHITFNLPYVILNVLPKLRQTESHLAEAARDLGCTQSGAFFRAVLPSIMPGIISGFIMSITMSLDDFIISYFANGESFVTLPILIYSMTKKRVRPDMYALSAIMFVTTFVVLVALNIWQAKKEKSKKAS